MANLGEPTKVITIEFEDKIDVRMDINIVNVWLKRLKCLYLEPYKIKIQRK